jgi:hypothetical protein
MKKIIITLAACIALTGIVQAQKAKTPVKKSTVIKVSKPASVAGIYSTDLGEDNIIFTTTNDNPTKLTYTISEVEFPMIYDETLSKQFGKLIFRHTTMDAYYGIEYAPGIFVHVFTMDGLKFDGTAMLQYVLVKNKADLTKYKSTDIKKSLNL